MRNPLLLSVALLSGCVNIDAPVNPDDVTEFVFEVPKGASASRMGPKLAEEGLVASEFAWKMGLRGELDGSCLKAGRFNVRRSMSMRELMQTMCGAPIANDVPFTVLEGWRILDIDAALVKKGWIKPGAYAAVANTKGVELPFTIEQESLEGYLFPETYMVSPPPGFTPEQLIGRQLNTFKSRFLDQYGDEAAKTRGIEEVVIMASLLEREEPRPANRRVVAGILWKRLDNGWQLGVDATSHYKLPEWNDRKGLLKALKDESDPYNTRIHKGLPPTAIGSPSLPSLIGAMNPEASPYWFYLHDKNQGFHGGKNAAEHDRNRKRYNVY